MPLKTDYEMMVMYNEAIQNILLNGYSYSIGDKRMTKTDIPFLETQYDKYRARYAKSQGTGGSVIVNGIPRRDY